MEAFLMYLLKSSMILSLFFFVYYFLLRKDTFFSVNRHFLLTGILCSLALPFLEFTTIALVEEPVFQIIEYNSLPSSSIEDQPKQLNWLLIAFSLYIIITLLLVIRFIFQLISLRNVFTKSQNKQKDGFSFLKTTEDIAPFSFFKYIIFNPSLHNIHELDMILKHEKIHAKQYHTLDILLINLFVIFQWINPFSWFYKKSLQQNLEFIADQETIRDIPSKKEYQLTLVKVSSNNFSSITTNFYQSFIKKRIVMLNKKESNHKNLWKIVVILPFLSIFLWSFNTNTEIKYIPSESQEHSNIPNDNQYLQKIDSDHSEEKMFLTKEKKHSTITEHSFPSKKESSTVKKDQNTTKNKSVVTPSLNIKKSKKEETLIASKNTVIKRNTVEFIINKNSTKGDLDKVKRIFENEYSVTIVFSDITRNKTDEITGISVRMSSEKSTANFSMENENPIAPIAISYDSKKDIILIGQSSNSSKNMRISKHKNYSDDGVHIIEIDEDDQNIFIIEDDKKHKSKIIRKKQGKNKIILRGDDDNDGLTILHSDNPKTVFNFDGNSGKDPLFIIDGKKASKKDVKKLKSDEIKSIDVTKGKASVRKHGKKAKDGVINITTKKGHKKGTGFHLNIEKNDIHIGSLDDNKTRPLTFINGKKVSYQEFQKINQDQIESVNVYKRGKAIKKYGDIAENGVVEVILKK